MAYWHMDRARYYASVGDDARALWHLSKFGDADIDANDAVEKERTACPLLVEELKQSRKALYNLTQDRTRLDLLVKQHQALTSPGIPRAPPNGGCSVM
jgi:hypothetical protein